MIFYYWYDLFFTSFNRLPILHCSYFVPGPHPPKASHIQSKFYFLSLASFPELMDKRSMSLCALMHITDSTIAQSPLPQIAPQILSSLSTRKKNILSLHAHEMHATCNFPLLPSFLHKQNYKLIATLCLLQIQAPDFFSKKIQEPDQQILPLLLHSLQEE